MQKKQKQSAVFVMLIAMVATLLSGCTTLDNFTNTFLKSDTDDKDVIKIGVYEPLSGKEKEHGELELQGIELAHELLPVAIGKKVELVYADNKSDVDVAVSTAESLVEKKVSVVLGSYGNTLPWWAEKSLQRRRSLP
jgi:branched-chain amino acid transport system substrate-binding protein